MDMVFALLGITIVLVVIIACVFIAAIRSGQFEDMEGPAWRVVLDEDRQLNERSPTRDSALEEHTRVERHGSDTAG